MQYVSRLRTASILFVLLFGLSGCGRDAQREASGNVPLPEEPAVSDCEVGRHGGRLVLATVEGPRTFNIAVSNESSTSLVTGDIMFSSLVRFDNQKQDVVPGLATRWERSADGTRWTFHLRKGIRWSDGTPITADDVMFTAQAMCDKRTRSARSDLFRVAGEYFKFEKLDERKVRVTLPCAYGPFLHVMASLYVLPRHVLEEAYAGGTFSSAYATDWSPESIVASGPFRLKEYKAGERVVLERNPYYWEVDGSGERLPYLDEIVFLVVPDGNTRFLKFQNGELDIYSEVRPEEFSVLKAGGSRSNYRIVELGPSPDTNFLWFNLNPGRSRANGKHFVAPHKASWFRSVNFRRAVAHSIDRLAIVRAVYFGRGRPVWGPTTEGDRLWYNPSVRRYEYDPGTARALLAAEGFQDIDNDGWLEDRNGREVEFTLITNSESGTRISMAGLVAEDLKRVGIKMGIAPIDFGSVIGRIRETQQYEACLLGLSRGTPLDPAMGLNVWRSSGRSHFWFPEQATPVTAWEAQVDSLMDLQLRLLDYGERKRIYDEVQELICDSVPLIYLASPDIFIAADTRLGNLRPSVLRERATWNIQCLYWTGR